jgi:hypothetical protein
MPVRSEIAEQLLTDANATRSGDDAHQFFCLLKRNCGRHGRLDVVQCNAWLKGTKRPGRRHILARLTPVKGRSRGLANVQEVLAT